MTQAENRTFVRSAITSREDCARLVNGLHAIRGHCYQCNALINAARPVEYRVRDNHGKVIITNWITPKHDNVLAALCLLTLPDDTAGIARLTSVCG